MYSQKVRNKLSGNGVHCIYPQKCDWIGNTNVTFGNIRYPKKCITIVIYTPLDELWDCGLAYFRQTQMWLLATRSTRKDGRCPWPFCIFLPWLSGQKLWKTSSKVHGVQATLWTLLCICQPEMTAETTEICCGHSGLILLFVGGAENTI